MTVDDDDDDEMMAAKERQRIKDRQSDDHTKHMPLVDLAAGVRIDSNSSPQKSLDRYKYTGAVVGLMYDKSKYFVCWFFFLLRSNGYNFFEHSRKMCLTFFLYIIYRHKQVVRLSVTDVAGINTIPQRTCLAALPTVLLTSRKNIFT